MVKFYRIKDTEIRKVVQIGENGGRLKVVALIGKAKDLVDAGVLSTTDPNHDGEKWLVVPNVNKSRMELKQYDTLAEAKAVF